MAIKFEIIGSALVITDTDIGKIIEELPKRDVYFNNDRLCQTPPLVEIYDTDGVNQKGASLRCWPLADVVDENDVAFTEATFRTFARENLAFNNGGGSTGSGWTGQVEFRSNLPISIGTPAIGSIYLVEKKTSILFGAYTTHQSGLYIKELDTGSLSDWRRLNVKVNFTDSEFAIVNAADNSKRAAFDLSLVTTSTTRNYTWQDKDLIVAGLDDIPLETIGISSSITADYNKFYLIDSVSGDVNVTLPSAVGNKDKVIKFKKIDNSNTTLVNLLGTVDGTTNFSLFGDSDQVMTIQSNGVEWFFSQKSPQNYKKFDTETQGLINQTTAFFDYHTYDLEIPISGDYEISFSFTDSINTTGSDIIEECFLVDPSLSDLILVSIIEERQDAAGTGIVLPTTTGGTANTGTNQVKAQTKSTVASLLQGDYTFGIRYRGSVSNTEVTLYKSLIKIEKL